MEEVSSVQYKKWQDSAVNSLKHGRLRTLIVLGVPVDLTGSGVVVKNLLKEFRKAGNEVALLTAHFAERTNSELGIPEGVPVYTVMFNGGSGEPRDVSFPVPVFSAGFQFPNIRYKDMAETQLAEYHEVYTKKLDEVIRDFRPDVIIINHLFLLNSLVKLVAPWIPVVSISHGTEMKMLEEDSSLLPMVAPGVRAVEKIIAVSGGIKKQAAGLYGIDDKKVSCIGNGYDSSVFYPREPDRKKILEEKYGITGDYKKIVVFVGKFSEWKGIKYLIDASKRFTDNAGKSKTLTLIAGNGSSALRSDYIAQIKERGLEDTVKIITPPDNRPGLIAEIMNMGDVFVLPSVSEPFGLVLLEALGTGLRAVYADAAGPAEFVPRQLVDQNFVLPIEPLKALAGNLTAGPADEASYSERIAGAVKRLFETGASFDERIMISHAVKHMSWTPVYRKIMDISIGAVLPLIETANNIEDIYAAPLNSPAANLKPLSGAKAEGLKFIIDSSITVPSGFVLTTAAFACFIARNKNLKEKTELLESGAAFYKKPRDEILREIQEEITENAVMPADIARVLKNNLSLENHAAMAVRSSAVKEDEENASYSGQYASVTGIKDYCGIEAGVREVWASLFSGQLADYRAGLAGTGNRESDEAGILRWGMAVIVQEYIDSKASGVAHSVNVKTGFPEIVIECADGAEDVTGGAATPDRWRYINKNGRTTLFETIIQPKNNRGNEAESIEPSLTGGQSGRIAEKIMEISNDYEAKTGIRNIDVEFCTGKDGSLYFLQARPLNNVCLPDFNPVCEGVDIDRIKPETKRVIVDGITANPGVAQGRLVVIDLPYRGNETDYYKIARDIVVKGDIVCTPTVNLSWIHLFNNISGLIAERGGVTSHSANIAREKGAPCIVGAKNICGRLKDLNGKRITLDAFNNIVYEGMAPLIKKPLNGLIWLDMRETGEYDRKEPSHHIDTNGTEWARKPVCPLNPLQLQLYFEAFEIFNRKYPRSKIPVKIRGNVIYAGYRELVAFGETLRNADAIDPFEFFEERRETVKKFGEMINSAVISRDSLEELFGLYSHMIMHFHLRAGFRRGAALALRDRITRNFPPEIKNIVNYLIYANSPAEMTETRRFNEEYMRLLRSLDGRTKEILAQNDLENETGFIRKAHDNGLEDKLHIILDKYRITRQQSDDWEAPLPMLSLVERIQKDVVSGMGENPPEARTVRTIRGFEAFLDLLRPLILRADPSFDFDYFVKVMILSEEQSVQVENERHWQHRWQQQLRTKLLEYGKQLVKEGLLSSPEDILARNKEEILNLAGWLENSCRQKEPISSDKAVNWKEDIDSIELHLTNKCNLGESEFCKGICTYGGLHKAGAVFPFGSLAGIAKFKPKLIYLCGGGEPALYADGSKSLADAIYRIRDLLPETEIILGTNGIKVPGGNWQKELASVRISFHVYREKDISENNSGLLKKVWDNIWGYFTGIIGEIWVTFRYDRNNYMECFSLIERLWAERDRLCRENPALYKKELGLKIMAVADDGNPGDPFRLSAPTGEIRGRWAEKCNSLMRGNTPFGDYLRKVRDGFVDTGFILPKELFTGTLPSRRVEPAEKCWPLTGYILAAADGKLYSCPANAAQGIDSLGTPDSCVRDVLNSRKEYFHNPGGHCREGCRMLTTFMSAPVVKSRFSDVPCLTSR